MICHQHAFRHKQEVIHKWGQPEPILSQEYHHSVMYLLDKLKPFEQKEHFSLKEQNGLGWFKWDLNSGPPG